MDSAEVETFACIHKQLLPTSENGKVKLNLFALVVGIILPRQGVIKRAKEEHVVCMTQT